MLRLVTRHKFQLLERADNSLGCVIRKIRLDINASFFTFCAQSIATIADCAIVHEVLERSVLLLILSFFVLQGTTLKQAGAT